MSATNESPTRVDAERMAREYLAQYEGKPGFERAVTELTNATFRLMRLAPKPTGDNDA